MKCVYFQPMFLHLLSRATDFTLCSGRFIPCRLHNILFAEYQKSSLRRFSASVRTPMLRLLYDFDAPFWLLHAVHLWWTTKLLHGLLQLCLLLEHPVRKRRYLLLLTQCNDKKCQDLGFRTFPVQLFGLTLKASLFRYIIKTPKNCVVPAYNGASSTLGFTLSITGSERSPRRASWSSNQVCASMSGNLSVNGNVYLTVPSRVNLVLRLEAGLVTMVTSGLTVFPGCLYHSQYPSCSHFV